MTTRYVLKMSCGEKVKTEFFYDGLTEGAKQQSIATFANEINARPDEVGYSLSLEDVPIWFDMYRPDSWRT